MKSNLRIAAAVLLLAALVLYVFGFGAWAGFLVLGAIFEMTAWILIFRSSEGFQLLKRGDT